MENLDCMDSDDLWIFWKRYSRPSRVAACALFDGKRKGYIRAAKDTANYAANKAVAQDNRKNGNITIALEYEAICDKIYQTLPDYARW